MWWTLFIILAFVGIIMILENNLFGIILTIPILLVFLLWIPDEEIVVYKEYNIYALTDNIEISGGGFLFHYVDSDLNYHVRIDYKDGKKVIKLNGNKVFLVETSENPKVEIYRNHRISHLWLWHEWGGIVDIKIFIPEKTMINEYNSDMK